MDPTPDFLKIKLVRLSFPQAKFLLKNDHCRRGPSFKICLAEKKTSEIQNNRRGFSKVKLMPEE